MPKTHISNLDEFKLTTLSPSAFPPIRSPPAYQAMSTG